MCERDDLGIVEVAGENDAPVGGGMIHHFVVGCSLHPESVESNGIMPALAQELDRAR
jgi:hypothetical protein